MAQNVVVHPDVERTKPRPSPKGACTDLSGATNVGSEAATSSAVSVSGMCRPFLIGVE